MEISPLYIILNLAFTLLFWTGIIATFAFVLHRPTRAFGILVALTALSLITMHALLLGYIQFRSIPPVIVGILPFGLFATGFMIWEYIRLRKNTIRVFDRGFSKRFWRVFGVLFWLSVIISLARDFFH